MRIAQVSTIYQRIPPKRYGAVERLVHCLTESLVKNGHDVTLFATGDAKTSAKLVACHPKNLDEAKIFGTHRHILLTLNTGVAFEMQDKFDVIHIHDGFISMAAANISRTPCIATIHSDLKQPKRSVYERLRKPFLVTISKSQAGYAKGLNHLGTVHNGLSMDDYPFSDQHEGYLLFVGRIAKVKGVHRAIAVAEKLGLPLLIAAHMEDREYFAKDIKPHLNKKIRYIGEVDEKERNRLMSKAMAFIHAVTWPEPFGLTLIEAMACGCPVVAAGQGSIPEIVVDGKTGFVAKDLRGLVSGVRNIDRIDRKFCREYALKKFSADRMADAYEKMYSRAIRRWPSPSGA
jgi:glycosyltransferase involved in cell wall biosynthesis